MAIFQPTDVSGIFAWYKAHTIDIANSGKVTYWQDSSGSGNHLTFIFPSANITNPVYVQSQLNGYGVVRFDGANTHLAGTSSYFGSLAPSSLTAFLLYKTNSAATQQAIFTNDNDDAGSPSVGAKNNFILGINRAGTPSGFYFSWGKDKGVTVYTTPSTGLTIPPNNWVLRSDRWQSNGQFTWNVNGADVSSGYTISMSQSTNNRIAVGCTISTASPDSFFDGDIAEIIAYSRRLSNSEVININNYLMYKYNLPNTSPLTLFMWTTDNGSQSGIYNDIPLFLYNIQSVPSSITLYTGSTTSSPSGITLYEGSSSIYNTGRPLYIGSSTTFSTGIPLYIGNTLNLSGSHTLYIQGNKEFRSLSLYMYGYTSGVSNIPLYIGSSTVFASGFSIYMTGYPTTHPSQIPLYIGCSLNYSGQISLYTSASTPYSTGIPLYTSAILSEPLSMTCFLPGQLEYTRFPLYTYGYDTYSGSIPLYIGSATSNSDQIPLYIGGKSETQNSMLLFIKQNPPLSYSGQIPLFTFAPDHLGVSGINRGTSLYMNSYGVGYSLPLVMNNTDIFVSPSANLNLPLFISVNNEYTTIDTSKTLFLCNNVIITGRFLKLYIRGDGIMDGALVSGAAMNLFIKQNSGSYSTIPLYLKQNTLTYSSGISLYTGGVYTYNSGVRLMISGGPNSLSTTLFITSANNNSSGISLYTNGRTQINSNNILYTYGF